MLRFPLTPGPSELVQVHQTCNQLNALRHVKSPRQSSFRFTDMISDMVPSTNPVSPVSLLCAPQLIFLSPCSQQTHLEEVLHQGCLSVFQRSLTSIPLFSFANYTSTGTPSTRLVFVFPASSGRLAAQVEGNQSHREATVPPFDIALEKSVSASGLFDTFQKSNRWSHTMC